MTSILSTIQLETTSTSGTLTSEQLATLQESKTNYIVYGTELFKLVDNNTSGDTLIYTCSTNDSGTLKVKSITVTISTLAWTYSELSSGGSSGTKKYQHIINTEGETTEGYSFIMYFTIISEKSNTYYSLADLVDYFNEYTIQYGSYLPATGLIQIGDTFKHIQAVGSPATGELQIVAQHENQLLNIGYACNNLSFVDDNTIIEI